MTTDVVERPARLDDRRAVRGSLERHK